ncbi:hypothetical protein ESCO_003058 [Escovopsis weberi]|uniref:Uncharacterized protein n=1 Tax=Escovopsis weberi TaxID=150374 RepID=A0A0M9VSM1_ESCWE|nr:hypothetical protein ESCO_003058 [Escovopsis weberi]
MSLGFNNQGIMLIGKAERPGPSAGPRPASAAQEQAKTSGLHSDASSITSSSTSSVASEKRSLLRKLRHGVASRPESAPVERNITMMPPQRSYR